MTDDDKRREGAAVLQAFFDQFGEDDVYKRVFLEELFRFLLTEFPAGQSSD